MAEENISVALDHSTDPVCVEVLNVPERIKRKAEESCSECLSSYCEAHFSRHELHLEKQPKLVEPVEELEEYLVCSDHDEPLEVWCQQDQCCICQLCLQESHKGHGVVTVAQARAEKQSMLRSCYKNELDQREKDLVQVQDMPEILKHSARKAVDASEMMFTELASFMEKRHCEFKELIVAQARDQLEQVRELENSCQQKMVELERRDAELNRLSQTEDIDFLLNMPSQSSQDFQMFDILPQAKFVTVESFLSNFTEHLKDILSKKFDSMEKHVKDPSLKNLSRKDLMHYYCQPRLNVYTAFRHHKINADCNKIEWSHVTVSRNNYNDNSRQVLCTNGLSGQHYWEVDWTFKSSDLSVSIAVAYDTKSRTKTSLGHNDQSWSLTCHASKFIFSHNKTKTEIIPSSNFSTVGVYLDHDAGILAFFGVSSKNLTLIHKVLATFTQPLYPAFYMSSFTTLKIH